MVWHNIGCKYVFLCPLGGDVFKVTARIQGFLEGQSSGDFCLTSIGTFAC